MTYFHLEDLINRKEKMMSKESYESYFNEKGSAAARIKRYIKANLGKSGALEKLDSILTTKSFISLQTAFDKLSGNCPVKAI